MTAASTLTAERSGDATETGGRHPKPAGSVRLRPGCPRLPRRRRPLSVRQAATVESLNALAVPPERSDPAENPRFAVQPLAAVWGFFSLIMGLVMRNPESAWV